MAVMLLSLDTMATQKSTKTAQNESEACHSSFFLESWPDLSVSHFIRVAVGEAGFPGSISFYLFEV